MINWIKNLFCRHKEVKHEYVDTFLFIRTHYYEESCAKCDKKLKIIAVKY